MDRRFIQKQKWHLQNLTGKKNDIKKTRLNYCKPIGKSMINDELDISKKFHRISYIYNLFYRKNIYVQNILSYLENTQFWYNSKRLPLLKEFFSPHLATILYHVN